MAFIMKKKKYRFNVDVHLHDLDNVTLVNEVLFAKIRLLDGGSFQEYSSRQEVRNHRVEWNRNFSFPCKMSANASTGVLDPCYLRISIRKEMKGGRSYFKLGFIDLNLAEYAGSGIITRRWLLEGYDSRHRLDNSVLGLTLKMHMLSGDILFKAPTPNLKNKQKIPTDDLATASTDVVTDLSTSTALSIGQGSSNTVGVVSTHTSLPSIGGSSLTTTSGVGSSRPTSSIRDEDLDAQTYLGTLVTDSGLSESSESAVTLTADAFILQQQQQQAQQHYHHHHQQSTSSTSSGPPLTVTTLVPGISLSNPQQVYSYGGIGGTGGSGGGGGGNNVTSGSTIANVNSIIGSSNCGTTTVSITNTASGAIIIPTSIMDVGHSRNSSNTSQMSKGSGYSSFSHSQHSRQSSEGDSGHASLRFSKSVSLLNRINQRAMNAMKLHIPALIHNNNNNNNNNIINNKIQLSQQLQQKQQPKHIKIPQELSFVQSANDILNECSSELEELSFCTPNSTLKDGTFNEEFRTPLNELPTSPTMPLSPFNADDIKYLNTPSPTYRSINSNSRSQSQSPNDRIHNNSDGDSPLYETESETPDDDDSGLEENFNSPRLTKIKSMENVSLLEMEYHKASQKLDRNSPRRLKLLAEYENQMNCPKIKSLNNLCFDFTLPEAKQLRINFKECVQQQQQHQQQQEDKQDPCQLQFKQQRKNSTSSKSTNSGKLYIKSTKVGNAKFIGNDNDNNTTNTVDHLKLNINFNHPIQKMRSMGTIPDVVGDSDFNGIRNGKNTIMADPFLTPTTLRKPPQFLHGVKLNEKIITTPSHPIRERTVPDSYIGNNTYTGPGAISGSSVGNNLQHIALHNSMNELRLSQLLVPGDGNTNGVSFMSRSPFERAYRRSLMRSSTLQQCGKDIPGTQSSYYLRSDNDSAAIISHIRPQSINAASDVLSSGSLVISESGSLDRMKSNATTAEKRKKGPLDDGPRVSDRVEETRVNPNSLIDEILKDTKLDQLEESAETSGLELYIARDGTAVMGSHEVKSRVSAGAFKQVVMENPR